jgi:hypothetical protein
VDTAAEERQQDHWRRFTGGSAGARLRGRSPVLLQYVDVRIDVEIA